MDIIKRSDAKAAGETKYFTGRPCINGHLEFRYVQSGGCAACIRAANGSKRIPDQALIDRKTAKRNLILSKYRIFISDKSVFSAACYGFAVMRFPSLLEHDVDPNLIPTGPEPAGTAMFSFYVHPDDARAVFDLSNAMLSKPSPQAHPDSFLQKALSKADADSHSPAPPESRDGLYN